MRYPVAVGAVCVAALLAGCGEDDGGDPAPRAEPPAGDAVAGRTLPARPDWAAQHRARDLAGYVSQCTRDFRGCDTASEIVERLAARYVAGTGRKAIESSVGTASPEIYIGPGPDTTEIEATRDSFRVVGRSRTGGRYFVSGRARDPESWSTGCAPAGEGRCSDDGEWE